MHRAAPCRRPGLVAVVGQGHAVGLGLVGCPAGWSAAHAVVGRPWRCLQGEEVTSRDNLTIWVSNGQVLRPGSDAERRESDVDMGGVEVGHAVHRDTATN